MHFPVLAVPARPGPPPPGVRAHHGRGEARAAVRLPDPEQADPGPLGHGPRGHGVRDGQPGGGRGQGSDSIERDMGAEGRRHGQEAG